MSSDSQAYLSYGLHLKEGCQFPWHSEEHEYDIGSWWVAVNGILDGQSKWLESNPVPVEEVTYGVPTDLHYILASKHLICWVGPEDIDPDFLQDVDECRQKLLHFVDTYDLAVEGEPGWILSSYMG